MNYKGAIMTEIYDMIEKYPNYTMGQIFMSFLRPSMVQNQSLYEVTDKQIYGAIENAKTVETE